MATPSGTDAQKQTVKLEMEQVVAVRLLVKLGLVTFSDFAEIEKLLGTDFVATLTCMPPRECAADSYAKKQELLEEELQLKPEDAEKVLKNLGIEKPEVEKEAEPVGSEAVVTGVLGALRALETLPLEEKLLALENIRRAVGEHPFSFALRELEDTDDAELAAIRTKYERDLKVADASQAIAQQKSHDRYAARRLQRLPNIRKKEKGYLEKVLGDAFLTELKAIATDAERKAMLVERLNLDPVVAILLLVQLELLAWESSELAGLQSRRKEELQELLGDAFYDELNGKEGDEDKKVMLTEKLGITPEAASDVLDKLALPP